MKDSNFCFSCGSDGWVPEYVYKLFLVGNVWHCNVNEAVFCVWGKKASLDRGAYRVSLFFCLSVCLSVCVCVTFVVYTYCGSCAKPISTNPGSMEESEYGLTRGTCFVAHRLEVVALAGLLWISWCVLGRRDFFAFFFLFFSSNAHGLLQV